MSKRVGLLTIHGMGETELDYYDALVSAIQKKLGPEVWKHEIEFQSIFYQRPLQMNQFRVLETLAQQNSLKWMAIREYLLLGLSDIGSLEHKAHKNGSIYEQSQRAILHAIDKTYEGLGYKNKPLIIVAHSMGSQVISNYLWDSQQENSKYGVWKYPATERTPTYPAKESFRRLETLQYMFSTGCNIPLLVAGHSEIQAIQKPNPCFQWFNYFDRQDPLSWPLKSLSPSYDKLIEEDIEISVGNILQSAKPQSQHRYWTDESFVEPLVKAIETLLCLECLT